MRRPVTPLGKHPLPPAEPVRDRPDRERAMKTQAQPATASEILEIVGPLDDAVLAAIVATDASAGQVLEALTWLTADDQIATDTEHGPRGPVLRVYEILQREEPQPDER